MEEVDAVYVYAYSIFYSFEKCFLYGENEGISTLYKCEYSFHFKQTRTFTNTDKVNLVLLCALKTLAYLLVSLAAGDADEFFNAASIAKGFGVLHVLGDDFVQCTADGSYCIIWHGLAGRACGPGGHTAGGIIVAAATTAW